MYAKECLALLDQMERDGFPDTDEGISKVRKHAEKTLEAIAEEEAELAQIQKETWKNNPEGLEALLEEEARLKEDNGGFRIEGMYTDHYGLQPAEPELREAVYFLRPEAI